MNGTLCWLGVICMACCFVAHSAAKLLIKKSGILGGIFQIGVGNIAEVLQASDCVRASGKESDGKQASKKQTCFSSS
jgi:hypothetical protein